MSYARKKEKKSFYYSKYVRKCNFCCIFAQNFRSMTIQEYISAHRERFIEEWGNLIRIPSVSCQAEHKADMQRCAEKWKEFLLFKVLLNIVEHSDFFSVIDYKHYVMIRELMSKHHGACLSNS